MPNSPLAALPLTTQQFESVVQALTCSMLGLGAPTAGSASAKAVRVDWQQTGQPAQQIGEDVAYLKCLTVDDQYNRVRDRSVVNLSNGADELTQYTRVWEVTWEIVGPNSFDHARRIRSALFWGEIRYQFSLSNLYLVPDLREPQRVPEIRDGQWWPRTDFSARFNEFVTEQYITGTAASVEVITEVASGIISDVVIK